MKINLYSAYGGIMYAGGTAANEKPLERDNREPAQDVSDPSAPHEGSDEKKFYTVKELECYLRSKYSSLNSGSVFISGEYLNKCLDDWEELAGLEGMLKYADEQVRKVQNKEEGMQSFQMFIDGEGNAKSSSSKATVGVNFSKRAAQIAAARTSGDMRRVIALLEADYAQVSAGRKQGMCDEEMVAKTKQMLKSAQAKYKILKNEEEKQRRKELNESGKNDMTKGNETGSIMI